MSKKQVRFNRENLDRLGNKGSSEDDADSAFKKLLDQDDDIDRVLMLDEEPETEKLKMLKRKWGGTSKNDKIVMELDIESFQQVPKETRLKIIQEALMEAIKKIEAESKKGKTGK